MSKHTPSGAVYSTDDLIRMAHMDYFGQYNGVVGRALVRLKQLEQENKVLRERLAQLTSTPDPQGTVVQVDGLL